MVHFRSRTRQLTFNLGLLLAAVLGLSVPGQARAFLELTLIEVTPLDGSFQYTYAVTLSAGSRLSPAGGGPNSGFSPANNFVTLYDIPGLVPDSISYGGALGMAGFCAHAEMLVGDTAPGEAPLPCDSDRLPNITTYWMGPEILAPVGTDVPLGTLSFVSTNALGNRLLAYTAATQQLDDLGDLPANNFSLVAGPGIPERPVFQLYPVSLIVQGEVEHQPRP